MITLMSIIQDILESLIYKLDNISDKNKLKIGYLVVFLAILPIIFLIFKNILINF